MSPPSRTSVQPWRRSQRYELERLEGGWYEARIEEFPEVFTAAPSREEARVAVFDALAQYLAACRDTGREPLVKGNVPAATEA